MHSSLSAWFSRERVCLMPHKGNGTMFIQPTQNRGLFGSKFVQFVKQFQLIILISSQDGFRLF